MSHHCHAFGCEKAVPPKMLMCAKHWRMVPRKLQQVVWATYVPGQEITKTPTTAYLLAQRGAVWVVFVEETGCGYKVVPEIGTREFMIGPAVLGQ